MGKMSQTYANIYCAASIFLTIVVGAMSDFVDGALRDELPRRIHS
jgi:hypothetical protein